MAGRGVLGKWSLPGVGGGSRAGGGSGLRLFQQQLVRSLLTGAPLGLPVCRVGALACAAVAQMLRGHR